MCNLTAHNAAMAVFFTDDVDVDFSPTLPSWMDNKTKQTSEEQCPGHGQETDANGPIAGPSNYVGAWQ